MRQFKEMLHLGTPVNVQDVLVQDHANNLPVRALQRQPLVFNAAIGAATATIVPRKKRFLMTNALTMMFMMMRRKPEEED